MKRQALKKATQQVKNLLAQAGLMDQLKKIRGFEEQLNNTLTNDLDSLPDWISSFLKIILGVIKSISYTLLYEDTANNVLSLEYNDKYSYAENPVNPTPVALKLLIVFPDKSVNSKNSSFVPSVY